MAINKYRIFCETEQMYVYKWDLIKPTACPNNNSHLYDGATIVITESIKPNSVSINNLNLDVFGRLRVTNSTTIFTLHHALGTKALYTDIKITGNATAIINKELSCNELTVYNKGDRIVYQSRMYLIYIPGNSKIQYFTGVLKMTNEPEVRSRIGSYDDYYDKYNVINGVQTLIGGNGHFFEYYQNTMYVVERTSTTGTTQTDYRVAQSNWNVDTFDGNGPSRMTIDPTKALLFIIEYAWLGVNITKMGFKINDGLYWCHVWEHSNLQVPYIRYAKLPIRYEIENVNSNNSCVMRSICAAVEIEGEGPDNIYSSIHGINLTFSEDGERTVAKNDWFPIFSIRLSPLTNRRTIVITKLSITTDNRPIKWRLILNPVLTNPVWKPITSHPDSGAEFDISSETVNKVGNVQYGYPFEAGTVANNFTMDYSFSGIPDITGNADIAGISDIITLQARGIANTASLIYSIDWSEIY